MLVICEDCAKRYNIDESRIKGNRARFTCNECGHIIIVDKSDLSRPLVRSGNQQKTAASPGIDLIREMEAPLSHENNGKPADFTEEGKQDAAATVRKEARTKKGLTLPVYFVLGGVITFLLTSGGIGYILSLHYSKISSQQMELHSDMLAATALVLLCTWIISFGILFAIGLYLSRSVNNLTVQIKRMAQGEKGVSIHAGGPREIASLAASLSDLSSRIR